MEEAEEEVDPQICIIQETWVTTSGDLKEDTMNTTMIITTTTIVVDQCILLEVDITRHLFRETECLQAEVQEASEDLNSMEDKASHKWEAGVNQ